MDEYVCITLISEPDESTADFSARLSRFWSHLLRSRPDEFKKVYAETTSFEPKGDRHSRQYLVEFDIIALLEGELQAGRIDFEPIDAEELYSKYEASPPHWMQIEH
jgi:hypothetical protein